MPIIGLPLSPGAFCRPEDVKAALGNLDISSQRDDVLVAYINFFSSMAEGGSYCDRQFQIKERVEYFDGMHIGYHRNSRPVCRIFLHAPPVLSTPAIRIFDDPLRVWGDSTTPPDTELVLWDNYHINYVTGAISFFALPWQYDIHNIKIIYTGGLVKDIIQNTAICPDDLRTACALQCAHWFRISNDPGAIQVSSVGGGQITLFQPTQILPAVKAVLQSYRRMVY